MFLSVKRSVLVFVAATALVAGLSSPTEAAPGLAARADTVTVKADAKAKVRVLANDAAPAKAKVQIRKVPNGLTAKVNKKRIMVVKAAWSTQPGVYTIKYRLAAGKKKSSSSVRVTVVAGTTLKARVATLPVRPEVRTGYDRSAWKHWNSGLRPSDGCDTRREVLIAEAVTKPSIGAKCTFTDGSWFSYYDNVTTTNSSSFDIDHLVPLAEAHDSGGHTWSAARREAYANDQVDARTLVAVTASSNRTKSDRDPAEWMPPVAAVHCRYIAEWVAVKTRWAMSVDTAERSVLVARANMCPKAQVPVSVY